MAGQGKLIIDGWQIEVDSHRIVRDGVEVKLEPRSMELLVYLAQRSDQVVTREEIEDNVWHGRVVGYEALSGSIAKIRKSFGDTDKSHRIIETIPKSGYRLIASVMQADPAPDLTPEAIGVPLLPAKNPRLIVGAISLVIMITVLAWWQPWIERKEPVSIERMAFPLPVRPSIAILPFINMSGDPEQGYFADGLTDDLITDLSKIPGLFVIARNTTFTYKDKSVKIHQIAEELGVIYVMEGSVRRAGNTVRINVQLIDALSGGHVWAEKYDGDMGDIFRLQDDVVAKIVYSLNQNIIPQKTIAETDVPEAYDLFLQGMKHYYLSDSDSIVKAIGFFKQAIELDSNYYRAYGQLAAAYQWILTLNWESKLGMKRDQVKELVKESLNIALKEPTSAAYRASAWMKFNNGHYSAALDEIDKAIALNPNDPYNFSDKAHMQVTTGPTKEIVENALRAIRLNPNVAGGHLRALGRGLFHQDRFLEAANAFERAQKLEPDFEVGYMILAAIYGNLGEVQKANAALKKYEKIRADSGHRPATLLKIRNARNWIEESHLERLLRGLRNAGMPEN